MRRIGLLLILLVLPSSGSTMLYGIEVQSIQNTTVNLQDFLGQPLLIMAMTSTCSSCKLQNNYLKQIFDASDDLTILSIACDTEVDTITTIQDYRARENIPWEIFIDVASEFSLTYQIYEYPNLMLFDTSGDLIKKWRGVTSAEEISTVLGDYIDITLDNDSSTPLVDDLLQNPFFIGFFAVILMIPTVLMIKKLRH